MKPLRRLLTYARPYWLYIVGTIVCGIMKFTLPLAIPLIIKHIIDNILGGEGPTAERLAELNTVIWILVGVMFIQGVATYFRHYLIRFAGTRVVYDLRCALYEHLQRLSLRFFDEQPTGAIVSRLLSDINAAQQFINGALVNITMDVTLFTVVIVVMLSMNTTLGLVAIALLPIFAFVYKYISPRVRAATKEAQAELAEMSGDATERISSIMIVQAFTQEKREAQAFRARNETYTGHVMYRVKLSASLQSITSFVTELSPILVLWFGASMALRGEATVGELVAFMGMLGMLYNPIKRLSNVNIVIQTAMGALERVFEFFDETPDVDARPKAEPIGEIKGRVEFKDVDFSYDGETFVLHDINFVAEPGQAVALVGPSGGGKSTVVKLITRFYDVNNGSVTIDGTDVRDVTMKSLRKNVGIVPQRSVLFRGTLRENILYGRPKAKEEEVVEAAKAAQAHDFIMGFNDGYDTEVGEDGVQLSGGQQQRMALARTFLKDPRILILDEATSALDSVAENAIQGALKRLMKGRTSFIIAHRLSTIIDADFILVLEDGRIVERGTHTELLAKGGTYTELCNQQFGPMLQLVEDGIV